jgi:PAS domain S-box-containing protein
MLMNPYSGVPPTVGAKPFQSENSTRRLHGHLEERTAQLDRAETTREAHGQHATVAASSAEHEFASQLIDAAPDAIVAVDAKGTIVLVNQQVEPLFGYRRDELLGQSVEVLVPERLRRSHMRDRQGYVEAPRVRSMGSYRVLYARRKDGTEFPADISLSPAQAGGSVTYAAIRDVTDRQRLLGQLEERTAQLERVNADLKNRSEELARSNAELETFAYVASHDLSEPLRAISGPIGLLARRYGGQLDPEADQLIHFVVDGAQRMQTMIDDLLAYSRVGRVERRTQPVDFNMVLDTVLTVLRPTVNDKAATISVERLPVLVGEATQLSQVCQNLVSNALKFTAPGVTPRVKVGAEQCDEGWRFSVTDNGIGIEARYRERIFGMFKRLNARDEYPGTGIGLALAKKIIERHGGRIGVEDAPSGDGSRFWFVLPAGEETPA